MQISLASSYSVPHQVKRIGSRANLELDINVFSSQLHCQHQRLEPRLLVAFVLATFPLGPARPKIKRHAYFAWERSRIETSVQDNRIARSRWQPARWILPFFVQLDYSEPKLSLWNATISRSSPEMKKARNALSGGATGPANLRQAAWGAGPTCR